MTGLVPCCQEYRRRAGAGPSRPTARRAAPGRSLARLPEPLRAAALALAAAASLSGPSPAAASAGGLVVKVAALAVADLEEVARQPDGTLGLSPLSPSRNLALGSAVIDDLKRPVPLADGATDSSSEWLSGTPTVYGRSFTVDLGMDRAINRVRVLAGSSARRQPEYFMRGYRLEAASQEKPDLWQVLAEERENRQLDVDTAADSTWVGMDAEGHAAARIGRFVRLTLIRQDRSNWVSLGDIEVYGTGYSEEGWVEGDLAMGGPGNLGRVRWQVLLPPGTGARLQLRSGGGVGDEAAWEEVEAIDLRTADPGGVLFPGWEPVERMEYRVGLWTRDPRVTPLLAHLEAEGDARLVAQDVRASLVPDTAVKGAVTPLTYTAEVAVLPGDFGVDLLQLAGAQVEVAEVRVDGRELAPDPSLAAGYRWRSLLDQETTLIELAPAERLTRPARLEIRGSGLFLTDRAEVRLAAGSAEQQVRDGFANWQNGRPAAAAGWSVVTTGPPPPLLGPVEVSPRPFSPYRDERVAFQLLVGNLQDTGEVSLAIHTLDGRRLLELVQQGQARTYRFEWDGRDGSGRIVEPGLYLYEVRVKAGGYGARRSGTVVVAY